MLNNFIALSKFKEYLGINVVFPRSIFIFSTKHVVFSWKKTKIAVRVRCTSAAKCRHFENKFIGGKNGGK
jgi:hypothetical protein